MHLRIATRQSELALWQARHVAGQLEALEEVESVELVPMSTRGDAILDRSLQKIGGKGLFIKELEIAMQAGRADLAVHSMKDVPAEMPRGFCIAAVLERANPFDALVTNDGQGLDSLPQGARVGSSSLRRQAQLMALRPDIEVKPLRGNVNTRLAKLQLGQFDAIMLACAGLERLGMADRISQQFGSDEILPAAAQGVVGVECLEHHGEVRNILSRLQHTETAIITQTERAVAHALQASCHSPVASFAVLSEGQVNLSGLVAAEDGSTVLREEATATVDDAVSLGSEMAHTLLSRGAGQYLSS